MYGYFFAPHFVLAMMAPKSMFSYTDFVWAQVGTQGSLAAHKTSGQSVRYS